MIEWLSRNEFWKSYDTQYLSNCRYITTHGYFFSEYETIAAKTDCEAITPPADEEDFAYPILRWYARIKNNLIMVTYVMDDSFVYLDFEGKLAVREIVFSEFKALGFDPHAVNSPISEW